MGKIAARSLGSGGPAAIRRVVGVMDFFCNFASIIDRPRAGVNTGSDNDTD